MARYHINPKNGNVGECKATTACPFGDLDTDHYADAQEARTAYEIRMASGAIPVQVKRSVWDLLRGVSEEEAKTQRLAEQDAVFQARFLNRIVELRDEETEYNGPISSKPRKALFELFKVAKDYKSHQRESLELLAHFDALTAKKNKLEATTQALVKENPYAFKESGYLGRWYFENKGERLLQPGQDPNLHADLKPHCEKLIAAHEQTMEERRGIIKEATALKQTIIDEASLDASDRAKISDRTRELFDEALEYRSPHIPQAEDLEDRRAWSTARSQALRESQERDSNLA